MFTVIKLGGCNGSGKTSVAKALLELIGCDPSEPFLGKDKREAYYHGTSPKGVRVDVLGSYLNVCGGMDTISKKEDRFALVVDHAKPGRIVFFEGLITGKTYGALGQLSEDHVHATKAKQRGLWLYAFMDTPFDVCVARTEQRRAAAAEAKGKAAAPLDPERTLRPTYDSCQHLYEKLMGSRRARVGPQPFPHPTMMLDHTKTPKALAKALMAKADKLYAG